jgi:hypothetical protein
LLKKRIYYVSGLDPRGVALYYRLFREESRKSANLLGAEFKTSKLKRIDDMVSTWEFNAKTEQIDSHVDYHFLHWDDVTRALWVKSSLRLVCAMIPYLIVHFKSGWFAKVKQAGKGTYYNILTPMIFSALALFIAILSGFMVYFLAALFVSNTALLVILSVSVFCAVVARALTLGEKWDIWWILQAHLFFSIWAETPIPALEQKLDSFADIIIADHLSAPEQDVTLVGHCMGTMLTVSLLSRLIQKAPSSLNDKLCLITLGQCIPWLSFMAKAQHFRDHIQRVINDARFPWLDYSARIDPFCFFLLNPAIADGVSEGLPNRPLRRTVRPFNMFSAEKYEQLKKDKLRIHFQYLMSGDIKTDYDFFEMIAQPNAKIIEPEPH